MTVESGSFRIQRVVTSGKFELDVGSWEVDNNIWLVGDQDAVVIIDAAHDALAIADAVGDRDVIAVLCTHGHNDHINVAAELALALHAPVLLHPADEMLWNAVNSEVRFFPLNEHHRIGVADTELHVIHTPGSVCVHIPEAAALFSGDTLLSGGPGATGRSYSDFPTIIESVRDSVLSLPPHTAVYTGHGNSTTIGAEAPSLEEWIARGY